MEGVCRAVGRVTCPKQKAPRIRPACPQAMRQKHEDRPWNHLNNGHGKGPGFSRWFTVKRQADKPANKGRHRRRYNQQINCPRRNKIINTIKAVPSLLMQLCKTFLSTGRHSFITYNHIDRAPSPPKQQSWRNAERRDTTMSKGKSARL